MVGVNILRLGLKEELGRKLRGSGLKRSIEFVRWAALMIIANVTLVVC